MEWDRNGHVTEVAGPKGQEQNGVIEMSLTYIMKLTCVSLVCISVFSKKYVRNTRGILHTRSHNIFPFLREEIYNPL